LEQNSEIHHKGRGAQFNGANKFHSNQYEPDDIAFVEDDEFPSPKIKTQYLVENAKKVVNVTKTPDMGGAVYVNPYQGCEHGCIYCYARNSHEYWGYSAGIDFESKIMIKKNAAELIEKKFRSKNWVCTPISLSGNTDCYQPAEKKFRITRQILEVCLKYRNPVGMLTKNALVLRDIDLLKEMASLGLVHVMFSITTFNEELRQAMEPRTVTANRRLQVMKKLFDAGIPVGVMTAPIIPGLNDHEIPKLVKGAAEAGASYAGYTVVRLNGSIEAIFKDWIRKAFPDKADKVLNQIAECHGGKLNDSRFGLRMSGEGPLAENIKAMHRIAKEKYMKDRRMPALNTSGFIRDGQLNLF
jgi:DNA repair photolyase